MTNWAQWGPVGLNCSNISIDGILKEKLSKSNKPLQYVTIFHKVNIVDYFFVITDLTHETYYYSAAGVEA